MGAVIRGIGAAYPDNIVTNADIEKMVDTNDEWIVSRTGIRERRILPEGSPLKASDFGATAAREAMALAGVTPDDIDGIICAGIYPDKQFPATACFIQAKLGVTHGFAFDVTAACAGFVFGVHLADLLIGSGQNKNILVVGSELNSRLVDWTDRNTCILFGDGAGAVVMSPGKDGQGVLKSFLRSDGGQADVLYVNSLIAGGKRAVNMDGKLVFKSAVNELSGIVKETLTQAGFALADLDLLVMHQANIRILNAVAEKLGLPPEKIVINVDRFGNTSAATIPIALHEAHHQGRLKRGQLVALAGIGGGMSWGCNLFRW